jgi:hypothetical protein
MNDNMRKIRAKKKSAWFSNVVRFSIPPWIRVVINEVLNVRESGGK